MQSIKAKKLSWWTRITSFFFGCWWGVKRLLPSRKPLVRVYLPKGFANEPRTRVAVHEAGHAIASFVSPSVTKIDSITVTVTEFENGETTIDGKVCAKLVRVVPNLEDCWEQVVIRVAGLAAEALIYGYFMSSDAEQDLYDARDFAERIIELECESGRHKDAFYSCPWNIDPLVKTYFDFAGCVDLILIIAPKESEILNLCYARAQTLIREKRRQLDALATTLEKKDFLTDFESKSILTS